MGQYTGLKDKNEKEIYKGDIIKREYFNKPHSSKRKSKFKNMVVTYVTNQETGYSEYKVDYCNEEDRFDGYGVSYWGCFFDVEIVGNIYENKELLK